MKEQWGKPHENLKSKADELFEREDKIQRLKNRVRKIPVRNKTTCWQIMQPMNHQKSSARKFSVK